MTKDEIRGLMNMVNAAYPSFMRNMTQEERKTQLILWYMMLRNDSTPIVESVIKRYIAMNKYPPSISDIREGIRQQTMPSPAYLLDELLKVGKVAGTIVKEVDGKYYQMDNTKELFDDLPIELRILVGDAKGLRNWYLAYKENPIAEEKRTIEKIVQIQQNLDIERMELGGTSVPRIEEIGG